MKTDDILKDVGNRDSIDVIVKPKASRTAILKLENEVLHISLKALPEKGEANKELTRFLSKALKKEVKIIKGAKSRKKSVRIL